MAITPRKPKELVRLLLADSNLRRELHDVVAETDTFIKEETLDLLKDFLKDQQVDIRLMSHGDVTSAIKQFYKEAKLVGEFIKLY